MWLMMESQVLTLMFYKKNTIYWVKNREIVVSPFYIRL